MSKEEIASMNSERYFKVYNNNYKAFPQRVLYSRNHSNKKHEASHAKSMIHKEKDIQKLLFGQAVYF